MTIYSVKLVNHTQATERLQKGVQTHLQEFFTEVFRGTTHSALVQWGTGLVTDSIVLHFVDDIDNSYLQQKMQGSDIRKDGGGHTRTRGNITGSEFYLHMGPNRTMARDIGYAKLAFHEALHNQFPGWSSEDMHGPNGGGGLASLSPELPLTEKNKEIMRRGISFKNAQLL